MCDLFPEDQLAEILGAEVVADEASSNPTVCTFDVESPLGRFSVLIRVEDTIETLQVAENVFPGGSWLDESGIAGYWAPMVDTLWFDVSGRLYAVQLTAFEGSAEEAFDIARRVALAVSALL
jgi:hypothetical protein